jgi:hypothetical protein
MYEYTNDDYYSCAQINGVVDPFANKSAANIELDFFSPE